MRLADAVRSYHYGQRPDHPGRNPANFSSQPADARTPEGRRFNSEVGNALRMYVDAKPGDLVLSPPIGHYDSFLVGVIQSEWRPEQVSFSKYYADEPIPSRRVSWLDGQLCRRDFPKKIARALQNPHAISQVERDLYFEIFLNCFDTFVWQDKSKINVFGNTYSSKDPLETFEAAFVIKYFAAAYAAYISNRIDDFNSHNVKAAIELYYDPSLILDVRQNFNSPGKFLVAAAAAAMALSIAGGIVASSNSASPVLGQAEVVNVLNNDVRPSNPNVAATVSGFVQSLSPDRLKELDENYGVQAREKIGMSLNRTEVAEEAVLQ